jgi:hypothetical protein
MLSPLFFVSKRTEISWMRTTRSIIHSFDFVSKPGGRFKTGFCQIIIAQTL